MPPRRNQFKRDDKQTSIADFFKPRPTSTSKKELSKLSPSLKKGKQENHIANSTNAPQSPLPSQHLFSARSLNKAPQKLSKPQNGKHVPEPLPERMDIDTPSTTPPEDPVHQLTQEELDVHDQLESLDCSAEFSSPRLSASRRSSRPSTASTFNFSFARDANHQKTETPGTADTEATPSAVPSDLDSSDDEIEQEVLRRSARMTKGVTRYGSAPRRRNLFGPSIDMKTQSSALARELREVEQKNKKREELHDFRKKLEEGRGKIDADELAIAERARRDQLAEDARLFATEKYSAPLPLFVQKVKYAAMPVRYNRHTRRNSRVSCHGLHDVIIEIVSAENESDRNEAIDIVLIPFMREYLREAQHSGFLFIAGMLYWMLVYDATAEKAGRVTRNRLLDELLANLKAQVPELKCGEPVKGIPSLVSVLQDYGAVFDMNVTTGTSRELEADCLDGEVPYMDNSRKTRDGLAVSDTFKSSIRNIGRACIISAEMIRLGLPTAHIIDQSKAGLALADMVLNTLGVCVRVVMSAFGYRLSGEIGQVIEAVLDTVPASDWPTFRLTAAQYLLSISPRLEQHLELVTFLLPCTTPRSRYLLMDVGFLSLNQWCAGPASNPTPRNLEQIRIPSNSALREGLKTISFTINDVLSLTSNLTDLGKDVDMDWAEFIAGIVKMIIGDAYILKKRNTEGLKKLYNVLSIMRANTRRIILDVQVQRMRISLDAALKIVDDLGARS